MGDLSQKKMEQWNMTYNYQTSKELRGFQKSQISRRRLLQLMGYSLAGMTGTSILAACGGPNPPHPVDVTITPYGTVTTNLGAMRSVTPFFLGYNNVPIHSPSWENPDVVKAAVQFKPGTLRYPGGTVANYWDWRTGWFLPGAPGGFLSAPRSIYRLQELQVAIQATGAIPIYVLNMLTSDLNTQLEMLSAAQSMGLPVQYVELGNEFYLRSPGDYVTKFATGADYGKMATSWIHAIRAKFPKVNIAAVGGVPSDQSSDDRKALWNQELLQNLEGADALTQHPYVSVTHDMIGNGTSDTESAMNIVDALSTRWQQFKTQLQSLPQNMKVWFTEYNIVDPTNAVFHTWIHGIFAAKMSLTFLEEERSELVCFYDMIGKSGYEVISSNQQFAPTAAGWSMRLLGDTMRDMTSARAMDFGVNSTSNSGISSPPLQGWIFTDGKRKQAYIVNSSANSFTWNVDSLFGQGTHFQQLSSDPFKRITGSSSLTINSGTLRNQLSLPAFSLTQLK
jgi:hypothetical protein